MKTVLFVGAGRHQRRAIEQARARGLRVAAVDRNADAPGLACADTAKVVDFLDVSAVLEVARNIGIDGVLTVSADRAVPVVAAVAEDLGLPGIGTATAHRLTHKLAMRRALAAAELPQPPYARLGSFADMEDALEEVRLPAVLKPVDSGGQRAVFRIENRAELERDLTDAIAESPTGEAILEEFVDGIEMNGIVVARDREPTLVSLSDRLRPPGIGFGVGWIHVYPPSVNGEQLRLSEEVAVESVRTLGLRDAIAFPQLIASPNGRVAVVEVAARIPGGQMADLVRHAVGVDLVEVALRQALGEDVPDDVALPRFRQPLAIRFFTAEPGSLPTGIVTRIGSLDAVLASEGVVQADTYLQLGETIRPVRRDGDRYRFRTFGEGPERGDIFLRHDIDLSLDAALTMAELEATYGVRTTYLLMTESLFYNLASSEGVEAIARLRVLGHAVGLHAVYPNVELDERFDRVVSWHNPQSEYMSKTIAGAVNTYAEPYFSPQNYRSDSNQHWRSGCPHEELRGGGFPWLQILVHPEIWVYEGATMGLTMRSMLNAEKVRRLEQLADDGIHLD